MKGSPGKQHTKYTNHPFHQTYAHSIQITQKNIKTAGKLELSNNPSTRVERGSFIMK